MDVSMLPIGLLALLVAMVFTVYEMGSSLKPAACADCPHCRALADAAAREQDRLQREYAHRIGLLDDDEDDRKIG
jgi:hypothetical protein